MLFSVSRKFLPKYTQKTHNPSHKTNFLKLLQDINSILRKAYDGSTIEQWEFYLATDDYASAPKRKPNERYPTGTEAPISKSFKSPFIGHSVADVASWLRKKPESTALEDKFFAVLDKKAKQGSVVLCRIGDSEGKGNGLSFVLLDAEQSSLTLSGMEYGTWEELIYGCDEYQPEL